MGEENETTVAIIQIVRDVLGKPAIGVDDDVFDHGATSLSFVRILAQIHQDFGVPVHAADLGDWATPRNLAGAVLAADPAPQLASRIGV